MNICSVVLARPDVIRGGTERTVWELSKSLNKKGNNVHIVYSSAYTRSFPSEDVKQGVYLHGVKGVIAHPFPLLEKVSFNLKVIKVLREIRDRYAIDIIAFHGPYPLISLILSRKYLFPTPLVYHTYAALPSEFEGVLKSPGSLWHKMAMCIRYGFDTLIEKRGIRMIDALIVYSHQAMREILSYYGYPKEKIFVIHAGGFINQSAVSFTPSVFAKKAKNVLLFIGNDWHRKGLRVLFLALRKVLKKFQNTILIVIGSSDRSFLKIPEKLGIKDNVIFTGKINEDKKLYEYYASCDIFVLPSFHEGFGIPIIEAMSFGKPIIATKVAAIPELVEHGKSGLLVNPGDPEGLSSAIVSLLSDNSLYKFMSRNAFERSKLFTWDKCADRILEIYKLIIHR